MRGWTELVRRGTKAASHTSQYPNSVRPHDCSTLAGLERLPTDLCRALGGFKHVYPRYDTRYYDGLVSKMLACGNPDQMGYIEYRCLHCGQGTHRVAMSCK